MNYSKQTSFVAKLGLPWIVVTMKRKLESALTSVGYKLALLLTDDLHHGLEDKGVNISSIDLTLAIDLPLR